MEGLEENYRALANAIVEKAAKDMRKDYRMRYRAKARIEHMAQRIEAAEAAVANGNPDPAQAANDREELRTARREHSKAIEWLKAVEATVSRDEHFFHSTWFGVLTDLDGAALLEEIQRQEHIRNRKMQAAQAAQEAGGDNGE